jgi:hypothetical protein
MATLISGLWIQDGFLHHCFSERLHHDGAASDRDWSSLSAIELPIHPTVVRVIGQTATG